MLLSGVVVCAAGCGWVAIDYYYISLESSPGFQVTERKKLNLKNLKRGRVIPTDYAADRVRYSLHMRITDRAYEPHLVISIHTSGASAYRISPRPGLDAYGPTGNVCASYRRYEHDASMFFFAWGSNCRSKTFVKVISFDVLDASGALVAQENIPFELARNGTYVLWDAI